MAGRLTAAGAVEREQGRAKKDVARRSEDPSVRRGSPAAGLGRRRAMPVPWLGAPVARREAVGSA